jgi:uncharacterized protein (DUF1330 family)
MSTYLINHLRIPGGVPNENALRYLEQVEATVAPYGGTWLAQGEADSIEGTWPGTVVLMEFPDRAAADAWHSSPEYQAILPLRVNNAISDIVLIDSLPEGFTVAGFAAEVRKLVAAAQS